MDLELSIVACISVLELEWISLLQFIQDLLLDIHWDQHIAKRIYFVHRYKVIKSRAKVWLQVTTVEEHVIKIKKCEKSICFNCIINKLFFYR